MNTISFDTLAYVKKLKAAGVPEKQAEVQAEAFAGIIDDRLATKQDLKALELRLTYRLTLRMGSMITIAVGILAAMKFFG